MALYVRFRSRTQLYENDNSYFDFVKAKYPYKYPIGKSRAVIEELDGNYFTNSDLRFLEIYLDDVVLKCLISDDN